MCFDHFALLLLSLLRFTPISFPSNFVFFKFCFSFACCPIRVNCTTSIFLDKWPSTGVSQLIKGYTFRESQPFLSQLRIANSASARDGGLHLAPSPCWNLVWFRLAHVLCIVITTVVNACVQFPCCAQKTLFPWSHLLPLDITLFLPPFLQWLQNIQRMGCSTCALLRAEHSPCFSPLHPDQLWVSVLFIINCKQKLLRWGLRDALTYVHNGRSLGVCLILCPLNRIMVVGSHLWSTLFLAIFLTERLCLKNSPLPTNARSMCWINRNRKITNLKPTWAILLSCGNGLEIKKCTSIPKDLNLVPSTCV